MWNRGFLLERFELRTPPSSTSGARSCYETRVDGRPVDFHPYHGRSGWLQELERLITDLRRDNVPPGRISVLLLKTPRGDEGKHLERMGLRRLSEDDVPHLGSASLQTVTWSIVSGFKGLENDVVILAGLTDIDDDWHRGVAYVGMSRARTRLHVIIHEECDEKRRERVRESGPCLGLIGIRRGRLAGRLAPRPGSGRSEQSRVHVVERPPHSLASVHEPRHVVIVLAFPGNVAIAILGNADRASFFAWVFELQLFHRRHARAPLARLVAREAGRGWLRGSPG